MRALLPAISVLLLAGCATTTQDLLAPPPSDPVATFLSSYSAKNCSEGGLALLVEPAAAQALLPEGYQPRDAGDFFGLGIPTGKAVVYLNAQRCETSTLASPLTEGQMNVYVVPPDAALPAAFDFYELDFATETPEVLAKFAGVGWNGTMGDVALAPAALPRGAAAVGAVANATIAWFSFDVDTPAENPLDGIGRFWRETQNGLARADHRLTTTLTAGAASCELGVGTPPAVALGKTECGPGDAIGIVLLPFDYEATFFLPQQS